MPRVLASTIVLKTQVNLKKEAAAHRIHDPGIGTEKIPEAFIQLDAIFRAFPDLLFCMDANGQIVDYKAGKASALYLPPEQFLGRRMQEVLPGEVGSRFAKALQETIETGRVISIEYRLAVPEGERWFEARLVPAGSDYTIAIVRDISERVKHTEQIQRQLQRLSALHSVDLAIAGSFELNITLSVILKQVINQLYVDAADILLLNPHTRLLEFASGQGFQTRRLESLSLMIGQGYAGKAVLERRAVCVPDLAGQPSISTFFPDLGQEKFTSYYAIPLIAKGQVKGVLELYHHTSMQPDDDWLDFLTTIAGQAAVAIDNTLLFQDLQRTNMELNLSYDAMIESWAQLLELSNRESGAHAYRVVNLTLQLASSMNVAEEALVHFRRGALLHDVGKLGIPEIILNKPGPLDEAEQEIMHRHPQLAYDLLSQIGYLTPAIDIPHYHHERWDGSGYPDRLHGEQIPFPARLFAVVDVFDALTSTRPYRPACSRQYAMEYVQQHSSMLFDPEVVEAFIQMMKVNKKPINRARRG